MTAQKPFYGVILLLAVATFAAMLTGCAPKQVNPLSMEIAVTDGILEPAEEIILSVAITNNDVVEHVVQTPGPETVRLYVSVLDENGIPKALGQASLEQDAMDAETDTLYPGATIEATVLTAAPAEPGEYRMTAIYKSNAEPNALLVSSDNVIGVLVE